MWQPHLSEPASEQSHRCPSLRRLEVCRAFGLRDDSPLTAALRACPDPKRAVSMAGKGIHAGVAKLLLKWLDGEGLLPRHVWYTSACSGVDFFAAALHAYRGGRDMFYVWAAEQDEGAREVLCAAWNLLPSDVYPDAAAVDDDVWCDLHVCSPDCIEFSKRKHGKTDESVAGGAVSAHDVLRYVRSARACVVVVENVGDPDAEGAITTVLTRECGSYSWRYQRLGACKHAGAPVERERGFWVGCVRGYSVSPDRRP